MSVAGILASSLFSNAVSEVAQKLPSAANLTSGAQSVFGALKQGMTESESSSSAGGSSVTGQLSQIGQDLNLGNLPAAQADFAAFKTALEQHATQMLRHSPAGSVPSAGNSYLNGASGESNLLGTGSDPLAAAMLAYGSLQQGVVNGTLNTSVLSPASTFSINA